MSGATALMHAVRKNHGPVIMSLTAVRAPLCVAPGDAYGVPSAASRAAVAEQQIAAVRQRDLKLLGNLLDASKGSSSADKGGAQFADADGRTAMHVAASMHFKEVRLAVLTTSLSHSEASA
jgi:hypothetical protein